MENHETDELEEEADIFAQKALIPEELYEAFIKQGSFTQSAIIHFAEKINREPGIIVGRLQKDDVISYSQNNNLHSKIPEIRSGDFLWFYQKKKTSKMQLNIKKIHLTLKKCIIPVKLKKLKYKASAPKRELISVILFFLPSYLKQSLKYDILKAIPLITA